MLTINFYYFSNGAVMGNPVGLKQDDKTCEKRVRASYARLQNFKGCAETKK